jgi:hypothetical protein
MDTSDDSEDEIGAMIYQQSRTAKARAAVSGNANVKRAIPNEESEYASPPKKMCKKSRNHRLCSHKIYSNNAQKGGVCIRHDGKVEG